MVAALHLYKITLLSNTPPQNYTTLKPTFYDRSGYPGFAPLQNYTTLKRTEIEYPCVYGFAPIQNYTTLKQKDVALVFFALCTYTKLHYSQTVHPFLKNILGFAPIQNYTTLKP